MSEAGDFGADMADSDWAACDLAADTDASRADAGTDAAAAMGIDTSWTGEHTTAMRDAWTEEPTREELAEAATAYAARVKELLDISYQQGVRGEFLETLDERTWCASVKPGTYLTKYIEGEEDPGSRAGVSDSMSDRIRGMLRERGLTLVADDRGLRVSTREAE